MARPLSSRKSTVDLAAPVVRVSRIRRDPPPPEKVKPLLDLEERDQWVVVVGVLTFAIAILVIIFGFSNYSGRQSEPYAIEFRASD